MDHKAHAELRMVAASLANLNNSLIYQSCMNILSHVLINMYLNRLQHGAKDDTFTDLWAAPLNIDSSTTTANSNCSSLSG